MGSRATFLLREVPLPQSEPALPPLPVPAAYPGVCRFQVDISPSFALLYRNVIDQAQGGQSHDNPGGAIELLQHLTEI